MGFFSRLRGGNKQEPGPSGWHAGTGSPGSPATAWPPPGPITVWPSGDFAGELAIWLFDPPPKGGSVEVAGESNYQGGLKVMAADFDINGPRLRDHQAVLIPEPDNPYDANAVRVIILNTTQAPGMFAKAGYLGRADAVAFRPTIDRLAALGRVVGCLASLKGGQVRGDGERNYIGVTLHLDQPANLKAELDAADLMPSWEAT